MTFKRMYIIYLRRDIAINKLNTSNEEAKEELNQLKAEMAKTKVNKVMIVQAAFDEKMAENIQLRRDVIEVKTECEKYKKISNDSAVEFDKLNANIKKLMTQLKQKQEDISKLTQNTKVMEQEIKDQESYIEKLRSNNDRLGVENSQIKSMHDEYMKENSQLWGQNKELKSQLNEKNAIIDEQNSEIQIHKDQVDNLVPENDRLQQMADNLKRQLEQAFDDNKRIIDEGEVSRAQQSIKLQSTLDDNKKLKDDVNKLKMDNERLKVINKKQYRLSLTHYQTELKHAMKNVVKERRLNLKEVQMR